MFDTIVSTQDGELAAGRPATQSSRSPWSAGLTRERDASRATDGIAHDDHAFHTNHERDPWWRVDLGAPHRLDRVEIVNRASQSHRFRRFRIDGSNDDLVWITLHAKTDDTPVSADPGAPATIPLASDPVRYVRIVLTGHESLHLRSVRVFGRPLPQPHATPTRTAGPGVPLAAETLSALTWQLLDPACRTVLAAQLRLLPWGAVGGTDHPALRGWHLAPDGRLALSDPNGLPVLTFDAARPADRLVLRGHVVASAHPVELREIAPLHRLATAGEGVDPAWRHAGVPRRRNLVITRAGPRSLHEAWPRDLDEADRTWDLCASYYDETQAGLPARWHDAATIQNDRGKFRALHQLLHEASPLWSYDHVMLIDDDMRLSWRTLNALFATVRAYGLLVAQPALGPDSHVIHDITRAQAGSLLRFTSFVEPMAPIFRTDALRIALPAFRDAETGFGVDHLWRFLLGSPRNAMAIIDAHPATHTRAAHTGYAVGAAIEEGDALTALYGGSAQYETYGRIDL